ncbi:uncharacterized protein [Spinacia oleracea]|uniref:RNase H type-1 domain-containing protein n=1 Tax=Spinacia oleracea TaxID=3562 RepID=A0ABM3R249_SPIOL|nr:uncharacterized protein LOC130464258 [Spinacia oleracea]
MIAKDFMIDKLEVETNALNLKLLLEKVNDQSHHEFGHVLREVTQLLGQNWIISFSHIPKFSNKVAHSLAAHSLVMAVGHKLHYIIPSCAKEDYEIDFEHANLEYVSIVRRNARAQALAIGALNVKNDDTLNKAATCSPASQIVFGSSVSTIQQVVDKFSNKDKKQMDKGKGKEFTPFVVGGSTIANAIECRVMNNVNNIIRAEKP